MITPNELMSIWTCLTARMSRHNVTDPDAYVSCPFNDAHQIPASRLQRHIMKCEKQHAHLDLRHCPFNYCHLKPASELRHHMEHCPDKALVERDVLARQNNKEVDENRKMGHFTQIEYQDDWADEDTKFEDWDNESEMSNKPVAPTAYDRIPQKARLPRSQPKALQQQHPLQQPSLATSGVGRGRGVWRYGDSEPRHAQAAAQASKSLQNGFHEESRWVTQLPQMPQMEDISSQHSTPTNISAHNNNFDKSSTRQNGRPNGVMTRGRGRGFLELSTSSSQSSAPKVGMAANFDNNVQSLLVTAGRGRGRGRGLLVPALVPQLNQMSEEQRKKEIRKWQKKKRAVDELVARQRNGEKLSQDEKDKLTRKEDILHQLEKLSVTFDL